MTEEATPKGQMFTTLIVPKSQSESSLEEHQKLAEQVSALQQICDSAATMNALEDVKKQVSALADSLKRMTESLDAIRQALPSHVPPEGGENAAGIDALKKWIAFLAEDAILSSSLFKIGRPVLFGSIVIGVLVWIGGTAYGGFQMVSVAQQSEAMLMEIRQVESRVTDAETGMREFLDAHTEEVGQAADAAVQAVNDESAAAIGELEAEKQRAISRLDVESLPDIGEVKAELSAVNGELEQLNARSLSSLIDVSVYLLFGASGLALILSVVAIVVARKR